MKATPRVFVSHSSQDEEITHQIVGDLKSLGALIWVDYEQIASGNFARSINEGLGRCDYVVVLATQVSTTSSWVQEEIEAAINLKSKTKIKEIFVLTFADFSQDSLPNSWRPLPRLNALNDYGGMITSLSKSLNLVNEEPVIRLPSLSSRAIRIISGFGATVLAIGLVVIIGTLIRGVISKESSKNKASQAGPAVASSYLEFLTQKGHYAGESRRNPIDGTEFIWIPSGPYLSGPDNDLKSCLGYWMSRELITIGQFDTFERAVTNNQYQPLFDHKGYEQLPVTNIELWEVKRYCEWSGCTLPTAEQWEKAARGPNGRLYPWGETFDATKCGSRVGAPPNSLPMTSPVGSFPNGRSPYGCDDMTGNVTQWVVNGSTVRCAGGAYDSVNQEDMICIPRDESHSIRRKTPNIGFRVCGPLIK